MNQELFENLKFSFIGQNEAYTLPIPLKESLQLINDFFTNGDTNKLCLVFPSKEYSAQWLSVLTVISLIESDYAQFKNEIAETYRQFKQNDKLKLNGKAIVEWSGIKPHGVTFKTKGVGESSGAEITIAFSDVIKLQKVDSSRKLSSLKMVKQVLPKRNITPIDRLLNINTFGNQEFIKNKICLVSKFKSYDDAFEDLEMNQAPLNAYFQGSKIDENGEADISSSFLVSNNLSALALYVALSSSSLNKIIIDGISIIQDRATDFSDIDINNIQTILITDLSEIDRFESIRYFGFEFFNFTKDNLKIHYSNNLSPFKSFENKLRKYSEFFVIKEICHDDKIEVITNKIHSIEKDESNSDLTLLKTSLIQLTNLISRVAHKPTSEEILRFQFKINNIESIFLPRKMWLGDSYIHIEESISHLKSLISNFETQCTVKEIRLKTLMSSNSYDYIICCTPEEAKDLNYSFPKHIRKPKIISAAEINDKLLPNQSQKAILLGWPKSANMNRILSSFIFSELTVLFYQFENMYYNSLQRRNKQNCDKVKGTISNKGLRIISGTNPRIGFGELYSCTALNETNPDILFDILDFELTIDNAHYPKYFTKGNLNDIIKAKRIVFENDFFIYTTESHKFLVINELIERKRKKTNIYKRKVESLTTGDVIAFINTDRDIMVELVEKNTNKKEFSSVKHWTELWKNLLKDYYVSIGSDFKKLVEELRNNDCKKHEATIRTWLHDESRIGPDDNADLISIALLTNSQLLNDNIHKVRESISKMTGWRMKASDFLTEKIKEQLHEFADISINSKKFSIDGLGSVSVLRVIEVSNNWDNIDMRYVNKLLQKEIN